MRPSASLHRSVIRLHSGKEVEMSSVQVDDRVEAVMGFMVETLEPADLLNVAIAVSELARVVWSKNENDRISAATFNKINPVLQQTQ